MINARQQGFTAVELLITLFVAAAFLIAAYQLFNVVIKDGGNARAESRAGNVAYDYMRRYITEATNPCSAVIPLSGAPASIDGLTNVKITVAISCPNYTTTGLSQIETIISYGTGTTQTVKYSTYTNGSTTVAATGLIGWWRFNGNATDSSGSGNNGSVINATLATGQNGQANSAYSFNGTSAEIVVPNAAALNPASNLTVSAWVYATVQGTARGVVTKDVQSGISNPPYNIEINSGTSIISRITNASNVGVSITCTKTLTDGWHLLTSVYSGVIEFYIDGVLCGTSAAQTAAAITSGNLRIGQQKTGLNRWFSGLIDDVRLYNQALTGPQVLSLYTTGARLMKQKGFTLVEMLVIAPIVILAIGAFLTVIISMTGEVLSSRGSNVLAYDLQDAINRIEQDVRQSYGFLAQNSITLSSPQGFNNSTGVFANTSTAGTNGQMLILNMPVTNGNPLTNTSGVVYQKDMPNACGGADELKNTPMTMNVVYFVKTDPTDSSKKDLWRRTIMPESLYTTGSLRCSTPWQQPSCLPGISGTMCKTDDVKLVEGVTIDTFSLQYFTSTSAASPNTTASNPAASVDTRNTALASTPTVAVSIAASQSVAGRTIERSASLRATRLETNASAIAAAVANTTPSKPVVSGVYTTPESAKFTWPVSPGGNVTYTVQYKIDSAPSWTTAVSNTSARTYTIAAIRGQKVSVQVQATNTAGSSGYSAITAVTIPLWNNFELINSWSSYSDGLTSGEYPQASYTKTSAGVVVLRGLLKKSSAAVSGQVITTLPVGYRPSYTMSFGASVSGTTNYSVIVQSNGDVIGGTDVSETASSLDHVVFLASDAPYTWTTPTIQSGFSNRNNTGDPPLSYTTDSVGRVFIRGALSPGPVETDGTPIMTLPSAVGLKQITAVRSGSGGYNAVNIDASTLSARGITIGSVLYPNLLYWPSSYDAGWTAWTSGGPGGNLLNGWVNFNAATNATAAFRLSSDGIVSLKGLIKSGTTTDPTTIAVLPVGSRPSKRLVFPTFCVTGPCRIDVLANGNVTIRGGSATYSAINGIHFIAEQ